MPIYEYRCEECGERFEKLVRRAEPDEPVRCPRCGAVETRKQFSSFAALGFERATGGGACCGSGGCG
jgi:putative FmdB family regulatory protein